MNSPGPASQKLDSHESNMQRVNHKFSFMTNTPQSRTIERITTQHVLQSSQQQQTTSSAAHKDATQIWQTDRNGIRTERPHQNLQRNIDAEVDIKKRIKIEKKKKDHTALCLPLRNRRVLRRYAGFPNSLSKKSDYLSLIITLL